LIRTDPDVARRDPLRFRTIEQWRDLPERTRHAHERSIAAVYEMEARDISRAEALRRFSLDPRTFMRHAGAAVRKRGRSWLPRRSDSLHAVMKMRTDDAETKIDVVTVNRRERRLIGRYDQLVKEYRRAYLEGAKPGESYDERIRGLRRQLGEFEGETIAGRRFLTDPDEIEDRIDRDVLEPEGPYDID
jgi:hypothetical protein